jgi:hypothetical protein
MSNISLVYGYAFNDLDGDAFDILNDLEDDNKCKLEVILPYTVGAANLDTAMIGITLQDFGLFWPGELQLKKLAPGAKDKALVDGFKVPASLKKYLMNKKPKLMIYGHNDD